MKLHVELDVEEKIGQECAYGNAKIWAEDCKNITERETAKMLSTTIINSLNVMSQLATTLFEKPKEAK